MKRTHGHPLTLWGPLLCSAGLMTPLAARALDFDLGETGATLNWDNTVKYSNAFRLRNPSSQLVDGPAALNQDDGDRNFRAGLISNRFDLFTEADLRYKDFGGRVSGAAWYDTVYNHGNDNNSPGTSNNFSVPYNEFQTATRNRAGRKGELLDAFLFGKVDLGSVPLSFRIGRHSLYWGETLLLGGNGIAGTMAPVDAVKALSVPGITTKEIFRPVGQLSGQLQFTPSLSVAGYYQYRWERTIIPPAGHFFSNGDILDEGGECLRFAPGPGVPCAFPAGLARASDIKARNSGQYGLQLRWSDDEHGLIYGLYATKSHAKAPQVYLNLPTPATPPSALIGTYQLVFPEDIKAYGASVSGNVGAFQLAAEGSIRQNMPLASDGVVNVLGDGNNSSNPLYPLGKTAHLNLLMMTTLPSSALARSASLSVELAWNRVLSQSNAAPVTPRSTRDATALAVSLTPSYAQVFEGMDLDVPISLSYNVDGNSRALGAGQGGHGTGTFGIGLKGTYLAVWNFTANYGLFFGPADTFNDAAGTATYQQALKDRTFVSFSASRTF